MIFLFSDCELDTGRCELRRSGQDVHLEPQVFGVLTYLVEHRDRVVPKTELLDQVWGDRFVGESALTSRIKAARRAVGDDGADQRIIRTVHGRGYHFVAPVSIPPAQFGSGPKLLERDDALATLSDLLDEAATATGRVILVAGEPGIGKTALVRSFTAAATATGRARVLWGSCDDLVTPRPLAPFHDMGRDSDELAEALEAVATSSTVQRAALAELERLPSPAVMVVEDVHWADEATLDLITFLARRMGTTPALLVLTYRDTELDDAHPLVPVIGSIPAEVARGIRPQPLSLAAVAELVGGDRAGSVMEVTKGNPFYVTELAAGDASSVPPSVRHAVLGRVAHFTPETRDLLGVLAVAPARLEFTVMDAVRPGWGEAVVPAERGGMVLVTETGHLQFRHELARQAVLSAMPVALRRQLHLDLLRVLVEQEADPARIVHHAEGAGDREQLMKMALLAARHAAEAAAHREALTQYRRALGLIEDYRPEERAKIYEEASREAYMNAEEAEALSDAEAALTRFEELGDTLGTGRVHRWISRLHWFASRRAEADAAAAQAVQVLEPLGPSTELAWAYSNRAQLAMLAGEDDDATSWGRRATELAERLGVKAVQAHALVTLGVAEVGRDPGNHSGLMHAVDVADQAGEHHEAARGLLGLSFTLMEVDRLQEAAEVGERALAYADSHEVHALSHYVVAILGRIDVLRGRWSGVEDRLRGILASGGVVAQLLAQTGLALLQVRRGDDEAEATLAAAWKDAVSANEMQRLAPLAAAEAERAWLAGDLSPDSPYLMACYEELSRDRPLWCGPLARWVHATGQRVEIVDQLEKPYRFELNGDWDAAADAWADRGMLYDQAFCLGHTTSGRDEALAIADEMGARPLAAWVRRRHQLR